MTAERTPPSGRWTFLGLFLAMISYMVGMTSVFPVLPAHALRLGATGVWLGIVFSAYFFARAISSVIMGRLSDVRGRKELILAGLGLFGLAALALTRATTVPLLALVQFSQGFGSGMVPPVARAYVGDLAARGREGAYLGTFNVSLTLGNAAGTFLGGLLGATLGVQAVFIAMAACSGVALLLVWLSVPATPAGCGRRPQARQGLRQLLASPRVRGVVDLQLGMGIEARAVQVFLPILAGTVYRLNTFQIGMLLSLNGIVSGLLQAPFGILADRVSRRRLAVVSGIGLAAVLFGIAMAGGVPHLFGLVFGVGVLGAMLRTTSFALAAEAGRTHGMGSIIGLAETSTSIGFVVAPLIGGPMMSWLGITPVFQVIGLILVLQTVLFMLHWR